MHCVHTTVREYDTQCQENETCMMYAVHAFCGENVKNIILLLFFFIFNEYCDCDERACCSRDDKLVHT